LTLAAAARRKGATGDSAGARHSGWVGALTAAKQTAKRVRALRLPRLIGGTERVVASPFFAYPAIAALQMRVIWNIWKYADLIAADSSYYYTAAVAWAHGLRENVVY
jgi:hypothetical protein